jgi:MerR family mercuric resistance operon transcriptional regulator
MSAPGIQIGDLSRRTRCNIETIRYYERIGLLPQPPRRGRYRQFTEDDVARLSFVRRARELGFTLQAVQTLLDLAAGEPEACAQARKLAAQHLSEVRGRIADLRRMERVLAETVRACSERDHTGCPLIDTLTEPALRTGDPRQERIRRVYR